MKKLFSVLFIFLALVLVTRFVSVPTAKDPIPPRTVTCYSGDSAGYVFDDNDVPQCETLAIIAKSYDADIKPIFAAKCDVCHGRVAEMPLYAVIPPSQWIVNKHVRDAKKHLDTSYGFPFRVDGTNKKIRGHDLGETAEVVRKGNMPPWYYWVMHWDSRLTEDEKVKILAWVKASRELLKAPVVVVPVTVPSTATP